MRPPDQSPRAPQTICTCHRSVGATQPPGLDGLPANPPALQEPQARLHARCCPEAAQSMSL